MTQAADIPQFTYHQWPDGTTPQLQFKPQAFSTTALARQLNPHYDLPSPSVSSLHETTLQHQNGIAPRPFVWDSINQDYFCYDPDTTDYVYARLGRIHYDTIKKEHYRGEQQLVFATKYPEYRVYQSGEMSFWDPRRSDWYSYDLHERRVSWRDQRWWPFPQKFEPPSFNSPPRSPKSSSTSSMAGRSKSPPHHAEKRKDRAKTEEPRVVEISPFDASTVVTDISGRSLPGILEEHEVRAERHRPKKTAIEKEVWVVAENNDIIYEVPPHRGHKKHRAHRGGTYDLQDLVDKSMFKYLELPLSTNQRHSYAKKEALLVVLIDFAYLSGLNGLSMSTVQRREALCSHLGTLLSDSIYCPHFSVP